MALGFSVHTGWAALVGIARSGGANLTVPEPHPGARRRGALFRAVIRGASEDLGLRVLQVAAPELVRRAARALGVTNEEVPELLTRIDRLLGPPSTADHKAATLAAVLALS